MPKHNKRSTDDDDESLETSGQSKEKRVRFRTSQVSSSSDPPAVVPSPRVEHEVVDTDAGTEPEEDRRSPVGDGTTQENEQKLESTLPLDTPSALSSAMSTTFAEVMASRQNRDPVLEVALRERENREMVAIPSRPLMSMEEDRLNRHFFRNPYYFENFDPKQLAITIAMDYKKKVPRVDKNGEPYLQVCFPNNHKKRFYAMGPPGVVRYPNVYPYGTCPVYAAYPSEYTNKVDPKEWEYRFITSARGFRPEHGEVYPPQATFQRWLRLFQEHHMDFIVGTAGVCGKALAEFVMPELRKEIATQWEAEIKGLKTMQKRGLELSEDEKAMLEMAGPPEPDGDMIRKALPRFYSGIVKAMKDADDPEDATKHFTVSKGKVFRQLWEKDKELYAKQEFDKIFKPVSDLEKYLFHREENKSQQKLVLNDLPLTSFTKGGPKLVPREHRALRDGDVMAEVFQLEMFSYSPNARYCIGARKRPVHMVFVCRGEPIGGDMSHTIIENMVDEDMSVFDEYTTDEVAPKWDLASLNIHGQNMLEFNPQRLIGNGDA